MAAVDNAQRPSQFLDKEDRALMAAHPEVAKKPTRGYTTAAEKKYIAGQAEAEDEINIEVEHVGTSTAVVRWGRFPGEEFLETFEVHIFAEGEDTARVVAESGRRPSGAAS